MKLSPGKLRISWVFGTYVVSVWMSVVCVMSFGPEEWGKVVKEPHSLSERSLFGGGFMQNSGPSMMQMGKASVLPPMQFWTHRPAPYRLSQLTNLCRTYPKCGRKPLHAKRAEKKIGLNKQMKYGDRKAQQMQMGGVFPGKLSYYVIEGHKAVKEAWPWMVGLFKTNDGKKSFLCGSSLISQWYVVTAAHCFESEYPNIDHTQFCIKVGNNVMFDGFPYDLSSILFHPQYEPKKFYNDIVLMRTTKPVILSENIYPICLPPKGMIINLVSNVDVVTIPGWGLNAEDGDPSNMLNQITVPIFPMDKCNESYSRLSDTYPYGIPDTFICAGHAEGGKDTCKGDSGGPLMGLLPDKTWIQLGVLSSGYGCARSAYPGLYTKISEYMDWIYDNTDLGQFGMGPYNSLNKK